MEFYEDIGSVPSSLWNSIVAIGNFDGVHLGHQAILREGKKMASANQKKLGVLTFEPHPRCLFRPDEPPFRITPPHLKQERLFKAGTDFIVSLPFDWDFASQSAEDFVSNVLSNGLRPSGVLIGFDFRFGQLRKGCAETIKAAGIPVTSFQPVNNEQGQKYSSSAVREALHNGDIKGANAILGWPWEIEGKIVRGDRRGHELGYPTANMPMRETLHPAYGIYASQVMIEGEDRWRLAAVNIGIRPMFELKEGQIEAHILDFDDVDIYGHNMRVRPVKRLRGEAKFSSLEALIAQIEDDCRQTREILTQACG